MALLGAQIASHPLVVFKDFRRFFFGRIISAVGDKFFTLAIAWWVISRGSEESKLHLSLLMAVSVLPLVLFGPAMGTLSDRLSRKSCMMAANFFRCILLISLFLLFFSNHLTLNLLYVLCFLISSFVPLFESSAQSSIESLTDEASVSQAVALNSMTIYLSNILGAMLGGIVLTAIGTGWAMAFNAFCYAASLLLIAGIHIRQSAPSGREGFSQQFKDGFRYLLSQKPIFGLLLVFAAVNIFAAPLTLLIPMIVKFILHEDASWLAILEASFASGAGLTAVYLSFRKHLHGIYTILSGCLVLMGLATCTIAFTPVKHLMIPEFFLIGVALSCISAMAISLFQRHVPGEMKGRFFSILVTVCFSVLPIAYVINGLLTQYMGIHDILILNGLITALIAPVVLFIPRMPDTVNA